MYQRSVNRGGDLAILLLHGNSLDGDCFALIAKELLLANYWLDIPDLPGHGRSDRLPCYSLIAIKEQILQYVTKIGCRRVFIVGHSLGGHLALQLFDEIVGCVGVLTMGTPPLFSFDNVALVYDLSLSGCLFGSEVDGAALDGLVEALGPLDASYIRGAIRATDPKFRAMFADEGVFCGWKDEVQLLKKDGRVPISCLLGTDDPFIGALYRRTIPEHTLGYGCSFSLINQWGHVPFVENVRQVATFITRAVALSQIP